MCLITQDCKANRHIKSRQQHNKCKICDITLCTHHTQSLCGCMLPEGHDGPHSNPWSSEPILQWTDEEGAYVNNQEDWKSLIYSFRRRT